MFSRSTDRFTSSGVAMWVSCVPLTAGMGPFTVRMVHRWSIKLGSIYPPKPLQILRK
ncbi:MAG TPA: hypothetical protein VFJ52_06310 [Terriglobia bacterium]|nr:hypothetical protein [Terriglobia bacterium]